MPVSKVIALLRRTPIPAHHSRPRAVPLLLGELVSAVAWGSDKCIGAQWLW
ncbi:hypothetical protein I546_0212 [Mycobacterium kansasii 732]|nr:hypothetical protein I546_0212 [Mycobacterium kansasii 732]